MILRFFPPLVTGTVITVIGLSLIGADIWLIAGDQYTDRLHATGVAHAESRAFGDARRTSRWPAWSILLIVLITRFTTGFIGQIAVLHLASSSARSWPGRWA